MTVTEQGLGLVRVLYFGLFVGTFVFFLQWESGAAKVPYTSCVSRWQHAVRNLTMLLLVVVIADLLIGEALLHAHVFLYQPPVIWLEAMSLWLPVQIFFGLLVSDLLEYVLHLCSHRIGWFWRLHAVHHSDPHLDVTTAGRSHPLEVSIYVAAKIALYALLGLPLWIEGIRAILHNTLLCVQHANIDYPAGIERLRWLLVTPGLHRLHHARAHPLINRNFGFVFPLWDRLFGTYQTPESVPTPRIGLAGTESEAWQSVTGMLFAPLKPIPLPGRR